MAPDFSSLIDVVTGDYAGLVVSVLALGAAVLAPVILIHGVRWLKRMI